MGKGCRHADKAEDDRRTAACPRRGWDKGQAEQEDAGKGYGNRFLRKNSSFFRYALYGMLSVFLLLGVIIRAAVYIPGYMPKYGNQTPGRSVNAFPGTDGGSRKHARGCRTGTSGASATFFYQFVVPRRKNGGLLKHSPPSRLMAG